MQSLTDRSEFMQRFMMARHEDQEQWGKSCPVFAFSGITMSRSKPTMFGVEMSAWIMNQVSLFIEWVSGSGFWFFSGLDPEPPILQDSHPTGTNGTGR